MRKLEMWEKLLILMSLCGIVFYWISMYDIYCRGRLCLDYVVREQRSYHDQWDNVCRP